MIKLDGNPEAFLGRTSVSEGCDQGPSLLEGTLDHSLEKDEELVARVAHSDAGALAELYDQYSQQVFSMAVGMLRDHAAAEDVTQEVFMTLWTRAATFDPARGKFKHWFLHLAHNRVIDELRRRGRSTLHTSDRVPEDPALALDDPSDTAEEAVKAVLFGDALKALVKLPIEQRTALIMAYLEGATQQEIVHRTGTPLGTVKTRLRLGMMRLRKHLAAPAREEV